MRHLSRIPALIAGLWLFAGIGCSAYDPDLLSAAAMPESDSCGNNVLEPSELCDTAIAAGMPGACPSSCPASDPCLPPMPIGAGCQRHCGTERITTAHNGDGCCPPQVGPAEDSDCGMCGDGIVGPSETCDPPGACPSAAQCRSADPCITAVFSGNAKTCTARCELKPITACTPHDECCPSGCNDDTDSDCSATCGDGIVEAASHETCEQDSRTDPCPVDCDDKDPCTRDLLVGSAMNCSARCSHTAITDPANGDGCCPRNASSVNDSDCMPRCGNGVTEAGEECDFGELCSTGCKLLFHPSLAHRYSFDGMGTSAVDSIGAKSGTLVNTTLSGDGSLHLTGGTAGPYVALPKGVVSGLTSATVEVWLTYNGATARWQRIFDFGNNQGGEGAQSGAATSFWFLTANNTSGYFGGYINFTPAAGDVVNDRSVVASASLRDGTMHQVAIAFQDDGHSLTLYLDGRLQQTTANLSGHLSTIDDTNAWIGRSNWGDPYLEATISEFRIYGAALSAADIRYSFQAGPSPAKDAAAPKDATATSP